MVMVTPHSFEEANCNLCGGIRSRVCMAIRIGGREVARRVRCSDCGLEYISPRPTIAFVSELYQASYAETFASQPEDIAVVVEGGNQHAADRYAGYVASMSQLASPGSGRRFLDVGAGVGHLLNQAKAKGWDVWGTEISAEAAERAKRRTGANIVVAEDLRDAKFPSEFFGAVTMSAVIEHLRDPLGILREIHRILGAGGILGVFTDNDDSVFLGLGQLREKLEVRYEASTGRQFPFRGRNKNRYEVIASSYENGILTLAPAKDESKTITHFCYWVFQHLFYFTPASLRRMLEKAGFSSVHYPSGSILGPPAVGKRRLLQNDLVNGAARLVGRQSEIVYYSTK